MSQAAKATVGETAPILGYYLVGGARRDTAAFERPGTVVDPEKKRPFDPDDVPRSVDDRLSNARKVVVPVHGYRVSPWPWARVWDEEPAPPFRTYDAAAFRDGVTRAMAREAGGALGDDVAVVSPVWPSNGLPYAASVRAQAAVTGRALGEHLAGLRARAPDAQVELVAHSAGGAVVKHALTTLADAPAARPGRIRQTLLAPDLPADSLTTGPYADASARLHSTRLVRDPGDRALRVARALAGWKPVGKDADPGRALAGPTDLPETVLDGIREARPETPLLGREGVTGTPTGTAAVHRVSLPGVLGHTGHADLDRLERDADRLTLETMERVFGSLTRPLP